jgi:ABC-type molybdate transport system substrate-binding protein
MYAGSLIKTFESTIGPSFQEDTGYSYVGEGKGSVQLANMIIDYSAFWIYFIFDAATLCDLYDHINFSG